MSATREIGSEANAYGRRESQRISRHLNATNTRRNSNECTVNGVTVVIKCARRKTRSVGVSIAMLERLHSVIGAFEIANGDYDLYLVSAALFTQHMRHRADKKIGIVDKAIFVAHGQLSQTVPSATALP